MPVTTPRRAVALLCGGLDSVTTLALARSQDFDLFAMTFLYGQRHAVEAIAARAVATALGVAVHREVAIDMRAFGGSALTELRLAAFAEVGISDPVPYRPECRAVVA